MKIMNSKSLNLPKLQILFDMKISSQEFNKWTLAYCWHFSSASKKRDLISSNQDCIIIVMEICYYHNILTRNFFWEKRTVTFVIIFRVHPSMCHIWYRFYMLSILVQWDQNPVKSYEDVFYVLIEDFTICTFSWNYSRVLREIFFFFNFRQYVLDFREIFKRILSKRC